jgi:HEAT repeat protein
MVLRFNAPPGWPAVPPRWVPPEGWQPDPGWPASPPNWPFWIDVVEDSASEGSLFGDQAQTEGVGAGAGQGPVSVKPGVGPPFLGVAGAGPVAQEPRAKAARTSAVGTTVTARWRRIRGGYARRWKRNTAIVLAAVLVVTVGVLFVPKWMAPDVAALQQRADTPGLVSALGYWADPPTRVNAATALGAVGTEEAVAPLLAVMTDKDQAVSAAASAAVPQILGRLQDDRATVLLSELADDKTVGPQATASRTAYLDSIGQVRALRALVAAQATGSATVSPAAEKLRQDLAGRMTDDQVVLTLIEQSTTASAQVSALDKVVLADRLASAGDIAALRVLLLVMADDRKPVSDEARAQISALLLKLTPTLGVGYLATLADDSDAKVKAGARAILTDHIKSLGDRAVPTVLEAHVSDVWLALALGVPLDQVSVTTKTRGIQIDPLADIKKVAGAVSSGKGSDRAAGYAASDAFHPIVLQGDKAFDWNAGAPTAVRFLELVGVVHAGTSQEVETCDYNAEDGSGSAATVTRYRLVYVVDIYHASTGELANSQTFTGGTPEQCAAKVTTYRGAQLSIEGSAPSQTDMTDWINSLVHAP